MGGREGMRHTWVKGGVCTCRHVLCATVHGPTWCTEGHAGVCVGVSRCTHRDVQARSGRVVCAGGRYAWCLCSGPALLRCHLMAQG